MVIPTSRNKIIEQQRHRPSKCLIHRRVASPTSGRNLCWAVVWWYASLWKAAWDSLLETKLCQELVIRTISLEIADFFSSKDLLSTFVFIFPSDIQCNDQIYYSFCWIVHHLSDSGWYHWRWEIFIFSFYTKQ